MYMFGGYSTAGNLDDLWKSADGSNWVQVSLNTVSALKRNPIVAVLNGNLVIKGQTTGGVLAN